MRPRLAFLVPGDPETRTGGYLYDRRIAAAIEGEGWRVDWLRLPDAFPRPGATDLAAAAGILAGIDAGTPTVIDGLAFSAMPEIVLAERVRLPLIALIHHPLALETGLDPTVRDRLFALERRALPAARRIVVTSRRTAEDLRRYGVDPGAIDVVIPGTDPAPVARGTADGPPLLLCVGTLTPRKGHLVLVEALARLRDRPWRLVLAGDVRRDAATAEAVRAAIAAAGIADRTEWLGEIDQQALAAVYDRADLFVLPSFHEGYGMAFAEALAHGLPIVGTRAGAIPETVPEGAGILVPPGDAQALAAALGRLLDDQAARAALRRGALLARAGLPRWPDQGRAFAALLAPFRAAAAGAAVASDPATR